MSGLIVLAIVALIVALVFYGKHVKWLGASVSAKREHERACALLSEEFVVVDLETTGLDAASHAIIEIGAIRVTPAIVAGTSERADTFQTLVKTKKRLSAKITEITGLTKEMLDRDGIELHEALGDSLSLSAVDASSPTMPNSTWRSCTAQCSHATCQDSETLFPARC